MYTLGLLSYLLNDDGIMGGDNEIGLSYGF